MRNHIKLVVALVILAVLVYLLFVFDIPRAKAPDQNTDTSFSTSTPFELVSVASPKPSSVISSPVTISGQARGNWYFEASFPIQIIGADGATLGSGHAEAQGDWMTADFVPFTSTITFSAKNNKTGFIRLMKDNPSGLDKFDAHIDVPVSFVAGTTPVVGTCKVGGCSGEICSDQEGMVSNCIYRPEFACYKKATCERQTSGQCGWTQTSTLTSCISVAKSDNQVSPQ